jgi:hypothetical protein
MRTVFSEKDATQEGLLLKEMWGGYHSKRGDEDKARIRAQEAIRNCTRSRLRMVPAVTARRLESIRSAADQAKVWDSNYREVSQPMGKP